MPKKHDRDIVSKNIDDFVRENGYPPTIRDVMRISDISSTSVARYILERLTEDGVLVKRNTHFIPQWVITLLGKKNG